MFVRCARCGMAFEAPSPASPCPRCGALAPTLPPTAPGVMVPPPTQVAPIYGVHTAPMAAPPTQVAPVHGVHTAPMAAPTQVAPPPPALTQPHPAPHPGPPAPPLPREDRGALAGRATTAAMLSTLAVVGACNPLGWVGIFLAIRAYAATGEAELTRAAQRTAGAFTVSLYAFGLTALGWIVGIAWWLFA